MQLVPQYYESVLIGGDMLYVTSWLATGCGQLVSKLYRQEHTGKTLSKTPSPDAPPSEKLHDQ